jgi:DNA repair exonuclease SbcCD nuclease subunit
MPVGVFFGDYGNDELKIMYEEIQIPEIEREYHLFFVADSQISLCDERDAALEEKSLQRQSMFVDENGVESWVNFDKMIQASNDMNADIFIMGGDILDSAMYASIDYVEDELEKLDAPYIYCTGNHDFEYGNEYFSQTAYDEYLPRLDKMRQEGTYSIEEYDDLVIIAVNDHNNQIDHTSVEGLKEAINTGKPVVVVLHVPIEPLTGDGSLLQESIDVWGATSEGKSKVIIGDDGCSPNKDTQEFVNLITAEDSPVQLVLGGHIHFYHKDKLNDFVTQIVSGAAYEGYALSVTLKP